MKDLISRAFMKSLGAKCIATRDERTNELIAIIGIDELPPAQPETHDKRTETHACDYISRQAVIDEIQYAGKIGKQTCIDILKRLPSEEPERKKGRWIPHEDEDGEHYGDKCSECGEWYVMPYGKTNFCPNCGADMRGESE